MLQWKPSWLLGFLVGLSAIGGILALEAVLIVYLGGHSITLTSFVLGATGTLILMLLLLVGYRIHELLSLRYVLDRDVLTIICGPVRELIPLAQIRSIVGAEELKEIDPPKGIWAGYWIGQGQAKGLGTVKFYATVPPGEALYVTTPKCVYAISPVNPGGFVSAVEARRRTQPSRQLHQETRKAFWLVHPLWRDRLAGLLVVLGLVANGFLFAYIAAHYLSLPDLLPFHFSLLGIADRIAPKSEIFKIPTIGLSVFLVNTVTGFVLHHREPVLTYLLSATAVGVQVLLLVATLHIMY